MSEVETTIEESVKIVGHKDVAVIEFDMVGASANTLSTEIVSRFSCLLDELKASDYKAAVLISKKAKIFIAGADLNEIKKINSAKKFNEAVKGGQEVMNKLEDLPLPVIAAIHGACMGGGTELVLACNYRLCSDDKSTKIGLPETKLGLIPGFGGCVRLPKIVGLPASLDIILGGKSVDSRKAKKIGIVDAVTYKENLLSKALEMAQKAIKEGGQKRQKKFQPKNMTERIMHSYLGRKLVYKKALESVLKLTHGHYPAPIEALRVIKKTYDRSNRTKALEIEREGFCKVAVTDVSKNLIQLFFTMDGIKKQTGVSDKKVKGRSISQMGVLGAGTMGGGIAYVGADRGVDVRLKDINNQALATGFKAASDIWQKKLKRRRIKKNEYQRKMGLISGGVDYSGFAQRQLVVEAIVEDMEIKKKVIAETAKHCPEDCIIATNTSSLSVSQMAEACPHPENFIGMHFFNPVDRMPLVEVIRGEKTSDETVVSVFELAKKMGKTPVVVKDGPGFLVNRLLLPYICESAHLLAEGMSVKTLDDYYVKEFGMPMGPVALMDEIGLDVCIKVLKIFKSVFNERIEIPESFLKLSQTDRLGKKNGKGYYQYDERGKREGVDESVYSDLGLKPPTDSLSKQECLERGIFCMINEAALALLEDRIVENAEEVDLAMIMGTGFPPFRGGLLRYADTLGVTYIADQLEIYANKGQTPRLKPSQSLCNMAKTDRTFH